MSLRSDDLDPSKNFAPRMTFGNWLWPSRRRQLFLGGLGQPLRQFLSVTIVVLLCHDITTDILRRHQLNVVPLSCEQATKMMGAATCLHADNATRQFGDQVDQRIPPDPPT